MSIEFKTIGYYLLKFAAILTFLSIIMFEIIELGYGYGWHRVDYWHSVLH